MAKARFSTDYKALHDYLDEGGVAILLYSDMKRDAPHRLVMLNIPGMTNFWLQFISQGWNGLQDDCERMNIQWVPVDLLSDPA